MTAFIRVWLLALATTTTFAVDLDGRPVTQLAPPGSRAVVLFFAASDCPISNRYVPEMQRLTRQFEPSWGAGLVCLSEPGRYRQSCSRPRPGVFHHRAHRIRQRSRVSRGWRMRPPPRRPRYLFPRAENCTRSTGGGSMTGTYPWERSGRKPRVMISKMPSAPFLPESQFRSQEVRPLAARL